MPDEAPGQPPGLTARRASALILEWGGLDERENQALDGRREPRGTASEKFCWRPAALTSWRRDMNDAVRQNWSDPVIEVYKRDIDRTLLRENLRRTYDQRFLTLKQMQRVSAALQEAMREAKRQS